MRSKTGRIRSAFFLLQARSRSFDWTKLRYISRIVAEEPLLLGNDALTIDIWLQEDDLADKIISMRLHAKKTLAIVPLTHAIDKQMVSLAAETCREA